MGAATSRMVGCNTGSPPIAPYRGRDCARLAAVRFLRCCRRPPPSRRAPRRRGDERQRAGAVRREGQRHAQPRLEGRAPLPHRGRASRLHRHAAARQLRGRLDRLHRAGRSQAAGTPQPPKRTTLYEQIDFWVVGLTFADFWRPSTATVRIGDRVEKGLHLLQVWMIRPMGGEEVLVLYPQDGYWRLRPLAPAGPGADRVRLVVPDRAGGGRGAADREDQGDRLRSRRRAPSRWHSSAAARRP